MKNLDIHPVIIKRLEKQPPIIPKPKKNYILASPKPPPKRIYKLYNLPCPYFLNKKNGDFNIIFN